MKYRFVGEDSEEHVLITKEGELIRTRVLDLYKDIEKFPQQDAFLLGVIFGRSSLQVLDNYLEL